MEKSGTAPKVGSGRWEPNACPNFEIRPIPLSICATFALKFGRNFGLSPSEPLDSHACLTGSLRIETRVRTIGASPPRPLVDAAAAYPKLYTSRHSARWEEPSGSAFLPLAVFPCRSATAQTPRARAASRFSVLCSRPHSRNNLRQGPPLCRSGRPASQTKTAAACLLSRS